MTENKKEHTLRILLQAAKSIVHTEGHEAVTVRRIAQLTGYSYPLLYHYFKDLNSLLWTLRLEMIEEMIKSLKYEPNQEMDPIDEIKQVFILYAGYFFDHPNVFRFFYFYAFKKPADDQNDSKMESQFQAIWQSTFARLLKSGLLDAADIEITAKTIIYSLQGMILLSLSANGSLGRIEMESDLDRLISYLFKK